MGYSPWGHKEYNTTESLRGARVWVHTHTHTHTHSTIEINALGEHSKIKQ